MKPNKIKPINETFFVHFLMEVHWSLQLFIYIFFYIETNKTYLSLAFISPFANNLLEKHQYLERQPKKNIFLNFILCSITFFPFLSLNTPRWETKLRYSTDYRSSGRHHNTINLIWLLQNQWCDNYYCFYNKTYFIVLIFHNQERFSSNSYS